MVTQIIQTLSSFFARESDKIAMERPPHFDLQKNTQNLRQIVEKH